MKSSSVSSKTLVNTAEPSTAWNTHTTALSLTLPVNTAEPKDHTAALERQTAAPSTATAPSKKDLKALAQWSRYELFDWVNEAAMDDFELFLERLDYFSDQCRQLLEEHGEQMQATYPGHHKWLVKWAEKDD